VKSRQPVVHRHLALECAAVLGGCHEVSGLGLFGALVDHTPTIRRRPERRKSFVPLGSPPMAVELVTGTFENRVGETFAATPTIEPFEPLDFVLTSCVESPHARPDHPAFSLFFDAHGRDRLPQQIFAVEHPELGQFDLFLVPIAQIEDGFAYEAVIN
jgi:hypothetical protein